MKACDGAKPKTAALSRRSELLRVERVDVVGSRQMASKSAVELAGDSRLADSGNAGLQNGREAIEGQTVGLATDSELEVFKPWGLVDGIGLGVSSEALG